MYIDGQRSWFMHGGRHEGRLEGGVATGAVVGVLLDLTRRQISFFVDGRPQVGRSPGSLCPDPIATAQEKTVL